MDRLHDDLQAWLVPFVAALECKTLLDMLGFA